MKDIMHRVLSLTLILSFCLFLLPGCADRDDRQIILTTGFEEKEVFLIGSRKCYTPEIGVYMRSSQNRYESAFGKGIWERSIGGETLEHRLKEITLSRLAQIKTMDMLAESRGLALSERALGQCARAAEIYYSSLSEKDRELLYGITEEQIASMYQDYALADLVYRSVTADINPEISDDEARTITVRQILIKCDPSDPSEKRQKAYDAAREILLRIEAGEEFESLADRYNEDDQSVYSFGKDSTLPAAFVETAFALSKDEVSEIVETEYGYHIIKCISTLNRDETDANKLRILNERKREAFDGIYDEFVLTQYSNLNQELWDGMEFDSGTLDASENFFDIYGRMIAGVL